MGWRAEAVLDDGTWAGAFVYFGKGDTTHRGTWRRSTASGTAGEISTLCGLVGVGWLCGEEEVTCHACGAMTVAFANLDRRMMIDECPHQD
jgi:hypothetical protein